LKGICFLSTIEAGFVFSGNIGTGIVMAWNSENGSWSPPSAIGLSGIGWGLLLGASVKHLVYLINDDWDLKSLSADHGIFLLGTNVKLYFLCME
jgi:lipid-binding SYLF domain-containing protein